MSAPSEPWRLWILLNVARGTLGREVRYGWSRIGNVQAYANTRLHGCNLRAEHGETGERWERVAGKWSKVAPRPVKEPDREPPSEGPRYYWQDQ